MSFVVSSNIDVPFKRAIVSVAAFMVVSAIVAYPILSHLYLPLVDLPNHVARHYLATSGSSELGKYYEYHLTFVPNSAVDLAWILIGGDGDPTRFSQVSISLSTVGMIASTIILYRIVWGVWSAWPSAVGLFAYHASFFWGFQNYVVALPFVVGGMALWFGMERKSLWGRLAVFTPYVLVLFLMHFFAFIGFAVMVLGREVQRTCEAGDGWKKQVGHAAILAIPFFLCLGYLVVQVASSEPSPAGSLSLWGNWSQRIDAIGSVTLAGSELPLPNGLKYSGAAILIACGGLVFFSRQKSGFRLEVSREMRGPILALFVLVAAAPAWLNGVAFVHLRFPILLAATLFASTRWRDLNYRGAVAIAGVVLTLISVRAEQFYGYAAGYDRDVRAFIQVVESVPAGSRLLPVQSPKLGENARYSHIVGYAVVRSEVFVPTLFQGVHGLVVREEWRDHSTPALFPALTTWLKVVPDPKSFLLQYVVDWRDKYTHVVMIDEGRHRLEPFEELVEKRRLDRFTLYEVSSH